MRFTFRGPRRQVQHIAEAARRALGEVANGTVPPWACDPEDGEAEVEVVVLNPTDLLQRDAVGRAA